MNPTSRHTLAPIRRRRFGMTLGLLTATSALVSGCASAAAPTSSDDIILARVMDLTTLDISRSLCDTCQIYNSAVYETVMQSSSDGSSIEPLLAESFEANSDNTQFTFTLRDDISFSDGSPVEAKDVKWSWERLKNLQDAPSYFMAGISSIETPDDKTVVVTSEYPNSGFPTITSASYMGIINSDVAMEAGATADADAATADAAEDWFRENSAGSGQYVLDRYSEGQELVLKANENYWGEKPQFTGVTITNTADSSAQLQQLQQGDVDVAMQLSFDALDQLEGDPEVSVDVIPSYNFVYLGLAPAAAGAEPLKDVRVREAIRMGIDYDQVIEATVAGHGQRQATGIANGFEGTADLPLPEYDPEGAQALLAEAGYPNGFEIEAAYPTFTIYGVDFNRMFQSIQQSLDKIGVRLTLAPLEYSAWADRLAERIPVTAIYFAPDHSDTSQFVQYFARVEGSSWADRAGLEVDPAQQELFARALASTGEDREQAYSELAALMNDDAFILPIVNPENLLASRADVTGNNYSVTRNIDLRELSFTN